MLSRKTNIRNILRGNVPAYQLYEDFLRGNIMRSMRTNNIIQILNLGMKIYKSE